MRGGHPLYTRRALVCAAVTRFTQGGLLVCVSQGRRRKPEAPLCKWGCQRQLTGGLFARRRLSFPNSLLSLSKGFLQDLAFI